MLMPTLARDFDVIAIDQRGIGLPDEGIAQNEQRKTRRLTLPILAIGGADSGGEGPEAPEELLAALTAYRDSDRAAHPSALTP